jgi:hypothetical protein
LYFYSDESGKAITFVNKQLVVANSSYTISVSPLTTFSSRQTHYTPPAAQTVTITNTGTGSVTLTQPTAGYYDIGILSRTTLAPRETATFTVRPKADLPGGIYNEAIVISGTGGARTTVRASFTVVSVPTLAGIPGLSFELTQDEELVFVEADAFDITEGRGNGYFSVTLYGNTDELTLYGVEYIIENIPAGAVLEYEIEKDGAVIPLNIYETLEPDLYYSGSEVTFSHGDRGVYKLYVDGDLAGAFTVVYGNEERMTDLELEQSFVYGSWYFAPVDLFGPDYRYEIISRPATLGGIAPRINIYGQFVFAELVMPVNISRKGEYLVKAKDDDGNVVEIFRITVK